MPTKQFGPFPLLKEDVNTAVHVQAGDTVRTVSEGLIDFGGSVLWTGAPILTADGDSWSTPPNYPAPSLRKNSLICKIGSRWYQGGADRSFVPSESGEAILSVNDASPRDNSRGWTVTVYVTPMGDATQSPPTQTPPTQTPPTQTPPAQMPPVQPPSPGSSGTGDYLAYLAYLGYLAYIRKLDGR
jgi:hypothetical protein